MTRQLSARITVSWRSIMEHRLCGLLQEYRLKLAGVPAKQATKALARARAQRFYAKTVRPEMQALIRDMERR